VTGLDHDAVQSELLSPQTEGAAVENGENGEDAPRRRRRRGGRNRSRRDRTDGEALSGDQNGELSEISENSEHLAGENANAYVSAPKTALETHPTPGYVQVVSVAEAAAEAPHRQSHLMPEPKTAAPLAAPEVTHQPGAEDAAAPVVQIAPVIATDAPELTDAPAHTPAPAPVSAPASAPVASAAATPATIPMPAPASQAETADIDSLLSAAGLTMAVTDPEKLRAVQVASEPGTSAMRVSRERKPLPPMPDEPLVQVETQR
jgi:ribonuclease E